MRNERDFFFIRNDGQLQAPCEYALIQSQYQVHFYNYKVIFYLTKNLIATDRIVMRLTHCPDSKLIPEKPVKDKDNMYRELHYYDVCDGVDVIFAIEQGMLVQRVIVAEGSCIDELHLEFEGQKQVILADEQTIRIEGLHECFQFKCPCAKSVIDNV